ncbi:MAG: hypothetical protein IT463_03825 [Planctomycetes bacterium]|nr:hypothetical protein [Planctomycetota bacterium]
MANTRAKQRTGLVLLGLLLSLSLVMVAWWMLDEGVQPAARNVASAAACGEVPDALGLPGEPSGEATNRAKPLVGNSRCGAGGSPAPEGDIGESDGENAEPEYPDDLTEDPFPWTIKATFILAPSVRELIALATIPDPDERIMVPAPDVELCILARPRGDAGMNRFYHGRFTMPGDKQGTHSVQELTGRSDFPFSDAEEAENGLWQVCAEIPGYGCASQDIFGVPDALLNSITRRTLVVPHCEDMVVDLGTIEITLDWFLGTDEVMLVGAFVHKSGAPLDALDHELELCPLLEPRLERTTNSWEIPGWQDAWVGQGLLDGCERSGETNGFFCFRLRLAGCPQAEREALESTTAEWVFQTEATPWRLAPAPSRRAMGRILDFGRVVANDALLEFLVSVAGRPAIQDEWAGVAICKPREDEPGQNAARAYVYERAHAPLRLLIGPGRWEGYSASLESATRPSPNLIGKPFVAVPATVMSVKLDFQPARCIPITVKTSDGSVPYAVEIHILSTGDAAFAFDRAVDAKDGQGMVPVLDGKVTKIRVEARSFKTKYEPATLDVSAEMAGAEVVLKATEASAVVAWLFPPESPAELQRLLYDSSVGYFIRSSATERTLFEYLFEPDRTEKLHLADVGAADARLTVWLYDRAGSLGYPDAILSGPVMVQLVPGEVVRIELPAVTVPPPWVVPAEDCRLALRCGGVASTRYCQNLVLADGSTGQFDSHDFYGACTRPDEPGMPDSALLGVKGESYPYALRPPAKPGGIAEYSPEVPVRIRVKAPPGMHGFHARATYPFTPDNSAEETGEPCFHEAPEANGEVCLWCPAGRRTITLTLSWNSEADGEDIPSSTAALPALAGPVQLEVPSDGTLEYTLEQPQLAQVTIKGGTREDGSAGPWVLVSLDDEGQEHNHRLLSTNKDSSVVLTLDAGRYRLLSADPRSGHEAAFELAAGARSTVELPQLPPPPATATLLLRFPAADVVNLAICLECYPVWGQASRNLSPAFTMCRFPVACNMVPEGLAVAGVPVGLDVVFDGWAGSDRESPDKLLVPFRFKAEGENPALDVHWRDAGPGSNEWTDVARPFEYADAVWHTRDLSALPGFALNACERMLPGEHRLALYDARLRKFALVTVTITADGSGPEAVEVKEALQKQFPPPTDQE